jgi:hypothetical protein
VPVRDPQPVRPHLEPGLVEQLVRLRQVERSVGLIAGLYQWPVAGPMIEDPGWP